jgi:hypothetical protein
MDGQTGDTPGMGIADRQTPHRRRVRHHVVAVPGNMMDLVIGGAADRLEDRQAETACERVAA